MSDISPKGFVKIPHTVLPSLKTLKETDIADRNGMDKSCQPSKKLENITGWWSYG